MNSVARAPYRARREGGAIAVVFGLMLVAVIGFVGIALDLAHVYARRTEMQNLADAAALAAARELDGTSVGAAAAALKASEAAAGNLYSFSQTVIWQADALSFAASVDAPESGWIASDAVTPANAAALRYARVDTTRLAGEPGSVDVIFMNVMSAAMPSKIPTGARATAGRIASQAGPLAVCALDPGNRLRGQSRGAAGTELIEYGFRRGVNYNLLNLNPTGAAPLNFVVNPVDFPGRPNDPANTSAAAVRPYACTGIIHAARVTGNATLYVAQPFPAALAAELNTRMGNDPAVSICSPVYAGPDKNIRSFAGGAWMSPAASQVSATSHVTSAPTTLVSVADTAAATAAANSDYGVLWSFSKAVRYDAGNADGVGANFHVNDWPLLYPVTGGGGPPVSSNETILPYFRLGAPYFQAPPSTMAGMRARRVLNVPLLSCPVAGATASVLGIGQFLMTAPATATPAAVYAEFGGLVSENALAASVALFK
ncbi:MAG: pilus assembly protein TadG-related protein [Pseudomonadota bacterium]